ncbi:DUF2889 domain-containing protein [Variovorax humicola]|uniref:DUF2889 domain-containing protein n=1 Tax=Variovorax humicola TaxID=1769758 RepID=A0ABU8VZV5_9BURK
MEPHAPAAPDARRQLIHTREIVCNGYARADGLFDIESTMRDTTTQGTDLFFKQLEAGAAIHEMRVVVTVDAALTIVDIEAHTDAAPTPNCGDSNAGYARLKGMTIGPGFTRKAKALVGGVQGCTHLTELLGPLGTTAVQTLLASQRASGALMARIKGDAPLPKPRFADSCQAYRSEGQIMKILWPAHRRLAS